MEALRQDAQRLAPELVAVRRDLHRHPELGFQEVRTAGVIAKTLTGLGLEFMTGVAKTGVIALLETGKPGPTVLVRFDMDALPIQEQNTVDYASQTPGVMHACGHDAHVAIGLGVARLLSAHREELRGRVKFMFQPAEEGLGGAEKMIQEGVLENPRPNYALSMHVWNEKPVGWVGIKSGTLMAGADSFRILIEGKGGHGAIPHQTADPVYAMAQIITALQSIVSRNVSPLETAVISVGSVRAGEAHNIIPQTAEILGTVRTYSDEVRELVLNRLCTIAEGVAQSLGCRATVKINDVTPAVINDKKVAQIVQSAAAKVLPEMTNDTSCQTMASEDMAYVLREIPGCYFFVGSANPEKGLSFAHHHPRFDIDEEVLWRSVAIMSAAVMELVWSE